MDKHVEKAYESTYSRYISIDAYIKVMNLECARDIDSTDTSGNHYGRNMDLLVKLMSRANRRPKPYQQGHANRDLLRTDFSYHPARNLDLTQVKSIKSFSVYDNDNSTPEKYFYMHSDIADGLIYKILNNEQLTAQESKKLNLLENYISDGGIINLSGKKYLVLKYNYDDSIQLIGLTKNEKVIIDKLETDSGKLFDASPLQIITIAFSKPNTIYIESDDLIYANKNKLPRKIYYIDEHDNFEGNGVSYDVIEETGDPRTILFDVNLSREIYYDGRMNIEIANHIANFIRSHDQFIYRY